MKVVTVIGVALLVVAASSVVERYFEQTFGLLASFLVVAAAGGVFLALGARKGPR